MKIQITNPDSYELTELMTFTFKTVSAIAKKMSDSRKSELLQKITDLNVEINHNLNCNRYANCKAGEPNTEYAKLKKLGYVYSCIAGYDNKTIFATN